MAQPGRPILVLLIVFAASIGMPNGAPAGAQQARKIPLTRTLKMPLMQMTSPNAKASDQRNDPAAMGLWPGAEDELPEGPTGFDVFADGTLVISDPLLRRLAVYDAQGAFKQAWPIGFASDSVTITSDGLVLVREANTGQVHVFDREGKAHAEGGAQIPALPQAQLVPGKNEGMISAGNSRVTDRNLTVRFEEPGSTMVSLEAIATDPGRGVFVALETTAPGGGDAVNVRKLVRRYSPSGTPVAESSWIPLDYFVLPVDELRVRKGVLYQLLTTRSEVRINEWDMNDR